MARTIKAIQDSIILAMHEKFPGLSSSSTSEWRLLTHVVAIAIHAFEIILDLFKSEIEVLTSQITPGTTRWYAEMSRRFQNGRELKYDPETAMYYYAEDIPEARIAKIVAVDEIVDRLVIKVAKLDSSNSVTPFTANELANFHGYIETIHILGTQYSVISTTPDSVRYNIEVFFNPAYPMTTVEGFVKDALENFKTSYLFNGIFYNQLLVDAILHCDGVLTVNLKKTECKGATESNYSTIEVYRNLHAGYFDYAGDSNITYTSLS